MGFIKRHIKLFAIVMIVVVVVFIVRGVNMSRKEKEAARQESLAEETRELIEDNYYNNLSDSLLIQMQPELEQEFGKVPDGFIWESDGTILSLGDKSMSAEEVVYAYFRGLTTLDMSTVQRYSRESRVIESYSDYFNEKNKNTDYTDQFMRNMYKLSLMSLEVMGIESQSVFAENKSVFTVKAKILDTSDKNFWKKDQVEIYENLKLYSSSSYDSNTIDMYLYDYISSYFEEELPLKDIKFDITLQRYPDLDSGWLVSIDTDVDTACKYTDGKFVVSYIKQLYKEEGEEVLQGLESGAVLESEEE